nr:hypothetical protein L204_00717 [Cryptococcus depauperatus CBS 7855]
MSGGISRENLSSDISPWSLWLVSEGQLNRLLPSVLLLEWKASPWQWQRQKTLGGFKSLQADSLNYQRYLDLRFSSSNQALLTGTRALYGIPLKGQIPKVFLYMNRWTMPYFCVAVYIRFPFLAFTSYSESVLTVFYDS